MEEQQEPDINKVVTSNKSSFYNHKIIKYIAMGVFILLPFIGFYLGMEYERSIHTNTGVSVIKEVRYPDKQIPPTIQPSPTTEVVNRPYYDYSKLESRKCPSKIEREDGFIYSSLSVIDNSSCLLENIECEAQGVHPSYTVVIPNNWRYTSYGGPGKSGLLLVDPNNTIVDISAVYIEYSLDELYKLLDDTDNPIPLHHEYLVSPDVKIVSKQYSTIANKDFIYVTLDSDSNIEKVYYYLFPNSYEGMNTLYRVSYYDGDGKFYELTEEVESVIRSMEFFPDKKMKNC